MLERPGASRVTGSTVDLRLRDLIAAGRRLVASPALAGPELNFLRARIAERRGDRRTWTSPLGSAHPAYQQTQVPVREHLLAADHISIPGIEPGADHGIALSQLRTGQWEWALSRPRPERPARRDLAPIPSRYTKHTRKV